jgi:hypothetical protein
MGLDISISTDKSDDFINENYFNEEHNFFNLHSLSREFCTVMCRKHLVDNPEMDQIGKIAQVDVEPIYQMDYYPNEEELGYQLEYAETEEERNDILRNAEEAKSKINGNLKTVLETVHQLIEKLGKTEKLEALVHDNDDDTIQHKYYFSEFNKDLGDGYIRNNFGRDLRNFQRFVFYAQEKGAETVWFEYY